MRLTYKSQSTVRRSGTSEVGRPNDARTRSMVIKAALGMDAAPMLAKVAVRLRTRI